MSTAELGRDATIQFDSFRLALHRSLRLDEVLAVAVNDGRSVLAVDRLSVATNHGNRCLVKAISGQDKVVSRSNAVKQLETIAARVTSTGQPLRYRRSQDDLSSTADSPLARYVTDSGCRALWAVPLQVNTRRLDETSKTQKSAEQIIGCLIAEEFSSPVDEAALEAVLPGLSRHIATAVKNARDHHSVFLLPMLQAIGRSLRWFEGRKFWAAVGVLSALFAFVLACFLLPWEYRVSSKGKLMPKVRSDVFAPWDADVSEIFVEDGDEVNQGDVLLQLRSGELQTRLLAASAEVSRLRELIATLESQANDSRQTNDEGSLIRFQSEIRKAEVELISATAQQQVIWRRIEGLRVLAPVNGVVATFQVERLLANRPVRRGEQLLFIVNRDSDWQLEVEIPEHRVGHVMRARDLGAPMVDFALATAVERRFTGRLVELSTRVDESEDVGAEVQGVVSLPENETSLQQRHIGAEVAAKIHCGKKSLGYVLFGDVVEFLAKRFWL